MRPFEESHPIAFGGLCNDIYKGAPPVRFFNFSIAIQTYFQKIGDPRDIAPSMSMGFTINHLAAVFLPAIGGLLWMVDYRIPFVVGASMSLVSLIAVQRIRYPS
jgi:hypothetical protein